MPIVKTTCTRDCPDACGLLVEVSNGRATGLKGAPDHPITRGFPCFKQRYFLERVYGPRRLTKPLVKEGAGWRELEWDKATRLLAGRIEAALAKHGPLSLFHYQGGGSLAGTKSLNRRFFNLLGGGTYAGGSLCGGAGIAGQELDFGVRTAHDPYDLVNSKVMIIWGRNPIATNVHLMPVIREAKARGAAIALIDPLPTDMKRYADYILKPSPGTDAFLALALGAALIEMRLIDRGFVREHTEGYGAYQSMINRYTIDWLASCCDVPAIQIEELASVYGSRKPGTILLGWGPQRYAWGGETFRLIDALAALTGNIGVSGGGANFGTDDARHFDGSLKAKDRAQTVREVSKSRIGEDLPRLADPPVEVGIITGANPAVQSLDADRAASALSAIGFLTVIDYEMTETANIADLVLPTTTFLEEEDVVGSYFHHYVGAVNKAIDPVGESKTDLEIFQLIAGKLDVPGLEGGAGEWIDRLLAPVAKDGITRAALAEKPWIRSAEPTVPFESGRFPTKSGRFNFITEPPQIWKADAAYPMTLVSPHPREWLHSELTDDQLERGFSVTLSPKASAAAGVTGGDLVRVVSPGGAFEAIVEIDDRMRDDVVMCWEGHPPPNGPNAVTAEIRSNLGNNASYNQVRVKLERV